MQKLLLITFIVIIAYINIGYFVQVSVQKELAQEEMKEKIIKSIPDTSLTIFRLNSIKNQIAWKEEGKEFWLNNELFDIVKTSIINGKTYIYCINDSKEEKLLEDYCNNTQKKSSSQQEQKSGFSFFAPLFINPSSPAIDTTGQYKQIHFCKYNDNLLSQVKKINSPPPKA